MFSRSQLGNARRKAWESCRTWGPLNLISASDIGADSLLLKKPILDGKPTLVGRAQAPLIRRPRRGGSGPGLREGRDLRRALLAVLVLEAHVVVAAAVEGRVQVHQVDAARRVVLPQDR